MTTDSPFASLDHFPTPSLEDWRALALAALRGRPLESLETRTPEGISIAPLYTDAPPTSAGLNAPPGSPPYTRAASTLAQTIDGWRLIQRLDPRSEASGRDALRCDIAQGVRAFWLPTYDAATDVAALDALFAGVDLSTIDLYFDVDARHALALPAAFEALLAHRSLSLDATPGGAFALDPLGDAARGRLEGTLEEAWRRLAGLVHALSSVRAPHRCVLLSLTPFHDAGADVATELACMLAAVTETLRALTPLGVEVSAICARLFVRFSVGADFFTEVAKLRAARALFSRLIARCGGDSTAQALTLHAQTSARAAATRDPWNNILRATLQCAAAAIGGVEAFHVAPIDGAPGRPFTRRVARNTQHVLRDESHLHRVIDPAAGAYHTEHLTLALAREAWLGFQRIEAAGGLARALADGSLAATLRAQATQRARVFATRERPLVGVSAFVHLDAPPIPDDDVPEIPPSVDHRDPFTPSGDLDAALAALAPDAPFIALVAAAAAGATLAQLGPTRIHDDDAAKGFEPLPVHRDVAPFEALRDRADAWRARHGRRPRVFLANLGDIPTHKPRAAFASQLFSAAGVEPLTNDGFDTPDDAAQAFSDAHADLAVICSSDARYPDAVPSLAPALRSRGAVLVALAGRPGDPALEARFRDAGVELFVHLGVDAVDALSLVLDRLEAVEGPPA